MSGSVGVKGGLLGLHLRHEFLDPINGKLVVTIVGAYPFVVLDPFLTHYRAPLSSSRSEVVQTATMGSPAAARKSPPRHVG